MSKRFASVIVVAAVAAASGAAHAGLSQNGLTQNGLSENGLSQNGSHQNGLASNGLMSNGDGVMIRNGLLAPNGIPTDPRALQAVKLVMPDGTELMFR